MLTFPLGWVEPTRIRPHEPVSGARRNPGSDENSATLPPRPAHHEIGIPLPPHSVQRNGRAQSGVGLVGSREVSGMESLEARTERYLQEAERVRRAAERTEDPENRTVLLEMAHQYVTAATMIEELRRYR
jgi:hypothetical protein